MNSTAETVSPMEQESAENGSFLEQHWQKLVAAALWLVLIGAYFWYANANELGPLAAVRNLIGVMQSSAYGPLIFIGIYALRPLIFFSAALLTVAGGFLFGPVFGVLYTIIGANTSALIAYLIGRYFGQDVLDEDESEGFVQKWTERLRNNSFETVMTMRFLFLPYDLVNYLAGFLRIDWKAFILATILGSIPGTVSFALFGASIEGDFTGELPSLNPWVLAVGVTLFLVSIGLSRYFKSREQSS